MHLSTMRGRTTLVAAAAGLALTACGGAATDEEPVDPAASESPEDAAPEAGDDADDGDDTGADADDAGTDDGTAQESEPSDDGAAEGSSAAGTELAMTECEAERYTVPYPADWQVNAGDALGDCQIFHPGEIDVPDQPQDRDLHWPASLYVDDVAWADAQPDGEEGEVLAQEEHTLDGHRAIAYEYESNGRALVPEGERSYVYIVDRGDQLLVATTSSVGDTDYERDKAVLDDMMAGLTTPAGDQPEDVAAHDDGARSFTVTARSVADGVCLGVEAQAGTDEACGPVDGPLDVRTLEAGGEAYLAGIVAGPAAEIDMIANDGSAIADEHATAELVEVLGESGYRAFAPADAPAMYSAVEAVGPDGEQVARVEL